MSANSGCKDFNVTFRATSIHSLPFQQTNKIKNFEKKKLLLNSNKEIYKLKTVKESSLNSNL